MEDLLLNTKECAYDAFGNKLSVGDRIAFAVSRWTGDYIMCKGTVVGWTRKLVKVQCTDGATNSDKPAAKYHSPIGRTASRKPDKILKLSQESTTESFCGSRNSTDWASGL